VLAVGGSDSSVCARGRVNDTTADCHLVHATRVLLLLQPFQVEAWLPASQPFAIEYTDLFEVLCSAQHHSRAGGGDS
jgi:hypothetical protein